MSRRSGHGLLAAVCVLAFCACDYDVPITPSPTRKVEERLIADWAAKDGKDKMRIRKFDDRNYIISYNGDLFRAHHSDVGKTAFVSVQDINSPERKYAYVVWRLSDDSNQLTLWTVNSSVIPKETKDSVAIQKLLEKNSNNPDLLNEEQQYTREK
jgi:hypothetical protein